MNQTLKMSHQTVQGNQRRVVGVIVLLIITILTTAPKCSRHLGFFSTQITLGQKLSKGTSCMGA